MQNKCKIEVFSADCPVCKETIEMVSRIAGDSCEVVVLDMNDPEIAERAKKLGIRCAPAVAVNGELAECCKGCGPDEEVLRKMLCRPTGE